MLYALTVSFAAVDWVMSLDPHWGSTIYGLIFLVGQGLSALCFSIIMLTVLTRYSPYDEIIKPMQFHDLGKLTLAFVMLFAYFSFSQWLIIWSGNLPDEISWFLHRIRGGWGWVIIGIMLLHFALPFALLLSRERKRAGRRLIGLAVLLMFMRMVDIYWYTMPNFPRRETVQHLVPGGADRAGRTVAGGILLQLPAAAVAAAVRAANAEFLAPEGGPWPLITPDITILAQPAGRLRTHRPQRARHPVVSSRTVHCGSVHRTGALGDVPLPGAQRGAVPARQGEPDYERAAPGGAGERAWRDHAEHAVGEPGRVPPAATADERCRARCRTF